VSKRYSYVVQQHYDMGGIYRQNQFCVSESKLKDHTEKFKH